MSMYALSVNQAKWQEDIMAGKKQIENAPLLLARQKFLKRFEQLLTDLQGFSINGFFRQTIQRFRLCIKPDEALGESQLPFLSSVAASRIRSKENKSYIRGLQDRGVNWGKGSKRRLCLTSPEEDKIRWQLALGKITFKKFEVKYNKLKVEGKITRSGWRI